MTLASVALRCAKQLGRVDGSGTTITDLETEIKEEIGEAITFLNRQQWHLTEVRKVTLTTVASQEWYSTVDLTTGAGDQDLTGRTTVDVNSVLDIDYIRETTSSLRDGLLMLRYRDFERLQEGSAIGGVPTGYTLYAGQIGIYPIPDQAYALEFSASIKPVIPTLDTDTSVWFDQARELVEAGACKRVCIKYLRDRERALEFAAVEEAAMSQLHREFVSKAATGKIRPHQ